MLSKGYKKKIVTLWKKGAFHIFIGNFLTKFVVFFGSIFLVRVLSKSSYGLLGLIENIYGYVYLFAGIGLTNAILRFGVLAKNPKEEFGYYKYILIKGSIFNIFLIISVGLFFLLFPLPEGIVSARWLFIILLLTLPFQFLKDANLMTFRINFSNKRFAITTFIISVTLIYCKFFAASFWNLNGVIIANVVVNALFGILLSILTYEKYYKGYQSVSLSKDSKKSIDKYSIQYMITNAVWAIFMLNDIFLLGLFLKNPTIIADYKVAYVFPGNLSIITSAIGIFVAPYFIKHELDFKWISKNYRKVLGITALIIGGATVLLIIIAKPLIILLYGSQYENTVLIMRLLLIAAFINGLRYTTANLLAALGQIKSNMIISILGVILQVAINIFMIPNFGAEGVAITSIIVYTVMALVLFKVFANKYYCR